MAMATLMYNALHIAPHTVCCICVGQSAEGMGSSINLQSAMCLLRGKAHSAMDNQAQAVTWLQAALKADPFCYEALQVHCATP